MQDEFGIQAIRKVAGWKLIRLCRRIETGNAGFAEDLTKWIFQETGVVKVVKSGHFRKDGVSKEMYRIKDDLVRNNFFLLRPGTGCVGFVAGLWELSMDIGWMIGGSVFLRSFPWLKGESKVDVSN